MRDEASLAKGRSQHALLDDQALLLPLRIVDGAQTTERNQFPVRFMSAQAQHHFVLYSRSYCHLCDDMAEALQVLGSEYSFTLEIIDVDTDEGLIAQFDELVPVLFGRKNGEDATRLCHYFFNEQAVRSFLASK